MMASRASQSTVEYGATVHVGGDIDVRSPSDKEPCHISGADMLPDGRLLVTDFVHSSVKLIGTNGKLIGHLKLPNAPLDVAVVSNSRAIVTYFVHQLQFINVTDTLTLGHTLQTNGRYNGIVYYKHRVIVTDTENHNSIKILDMTGKYLSKIQTRSERLMYTNVAINPSDRVIYVTDCNSHTVTCITLDGSVLAVYKHEKLRNPRGLVVHPNGTVYVCGFGSHNVHHVTSRCLHIKTILDNGDVHHPWSICCNQRGDKLYVSEVHSDRIKVYTLRK